MELFSHAWWMALASIIVIDLVLAGDNALVIGIAASRLPPHLRRKAIVFGAAGAIIVRAALTLVVVWLLRIPGLLLIGGLLLLPIAWKLARPADAGTDAHGHAAAETFWGAMKTIIIADALMGVDNVLAIGGAAQGRWDLVIIGLLVTIPLVVWGSGFVTRMLERWPLLAAFGAAILAVTGAGMLVKDPLFDQYVIDSLTFDRGAQVVSAVVMFVAGWLAWKRAGQPGGTAAST
ncbi:MAG TPA: TerC family protein [Burkholderiaceae bacterium]|nr:TerC family protein [Burkholderiaceae bacterium]